MKRWSYATAIMLSLAGGTIMTGCIDNDEPYGIEQIRLATADLLKSKKAAAEAAAETEKLKQEIEKIRQETEKIKQEAELIKAQADAEQTKAETEAKIAMWKAQLQEYIALAEINVKDAQLKYDQALYAFEEEKRKNAGSANLKLYQAWEGAFQAYLYQLAEVNSLNAQLLIAQKDYAMAEVDLKLENGKWVSKKYDVVAKLSESVAYLEKEIQKMNDGIKFQQNVIADFENVKASDLYKLFEKYNAASEANDIALENAEVEKAALAVENKALYDSRVELDKKRDELYAQEIAIPAYTYKPGSALEALGVDEEIPVVEENLAYSLNGIASNPDNNYKNAVGNYTAAITNLTNYLLDDNDKAWTAARKKEISRELETANSEYGVAKKAWSLAKEVYNGGDKPNVANLPGEAAVDAAIAAFAAKKAVIDPLRDALVAANKKYEEAEEAADKALEVFNGTEDAAATNALAVAAEALRVARHEWTEAKDEANAKKIAAIDAAQKAKEAIVRNAQMTIVNANNAQFRAEQEYNLAESQLLDNPTDENLKAAFETAKENLENAQKALVTARNKAAQDMSEANADYKVSSQKADSDCLKAIHAADLAYDNANAAYIKAIAGYDQAKDPAYAPVLAANKAVDQAATDQETAQTNFDNEVENIKPLIEAILEAIDEQEEALSFSIDGTPYDWTWTPYTPIFALSLDEYTNVAAKDLASYPEAVAPIYFIVQGQYMNAKGLLMRASQIAYGNLGMRYDNGEYDFEPDYAFLVDVTPQIVTEYIAQYVKKYNVNIEPYQYITEYYNFFSYYGETLYLENRLAVADACLAQSDLVANATKEMKDNLQALEDSKDAQEEAVRKVGEEWNAVNDQIKELEQGVRDKIKDCEHMQGQYEHLLSQITQAIAATEDGIKTDGMKNIDEILKDLIASANASIEGCNNQIEYLNKELAKANYQLKLYEENPDTVLPNPNSIALSIAQNNLAAAQERLEFLKNRADELQAQYEAATKQQ